MKSLFKKFNAIPQSAKSTIAFIVASFILKGLSFITAPIFTRIMDETQYGVIATYTSWMSIIEVIALVGLTSAGVFNVGLNEYREDRGAYVSAILGLCNIVTLVVFAILFACKFAMGERFFIPTNQLVLMLIQLLFNPAQVFWITWQKYEYKYKAAFIVTVLSAIVSQAVSVVVVKNIGRQNLGEVKLWTSALVNLAFMLPIYVYLFVNGKRFVDIGRWKKVLLFALPLIPHYLAQHIMNGIDRIMVDAMVSTADAGIYSLVANIGMLATLVWTAVNASLIPFTFEKLNDGDGKAINGVTTVLILFYGVACVSVTLIAPEVLKILAPESYAPGLYAVPPIAGVAFLSALYNIYANIEFYHKKPGWITLSTVVATLVNVALNWLFIPKYSYYAASYTTLISYIVLVFMHYLGYKRCHKQPLYNNRIILLISAVCIALCVLCNFVYFSVIIRYVLLALIVVALIWKRKFIMDILKRMREKK